MTCTHCGSHYINSDGRCGLCARQVIHPIVKEISKDELKEQCLKMNSIEGKRYVKEGQLNLKGLTIEQKTCTAKGI